MPEPIQPNQPPQAQRVRTPRDLMHGELAEVRGGNVNDIDAYAGTVTISGSNITTAIPSSAKIFKFGDDLLLKSSFPNSTFTLVTLFTCFMLLLLLDILLSVIFLDESFIFLDLL